MRFIDSIKFRLEQIVLSGTRGRLVLMAGLVLALSVIAGGVAMSLGAGFAGFGEAVWWAFLRLTDPGYLGNDAGGVRRGISTSLTILGLAVFVGGLVAIMTQWLNETVQKLEAGLTPLRLSEHIVVLGWTDRTVTIVRELLGSPERAGHFLRTHHSSKLQIVVLADQLDAKRIHEFRTQLGDRWDSSRVTLRSGTPLRIEHLRRVDFLRAAVIVLPGADFGAGGAQAVDTRTVKTILAIAGAARTELEARPDEQMPLLIAEMYDSRKLAIAKRAYPGAIEVLASDQLTSSLMVQNTRHRNLSYIYTGLLDQDANQLFVRGFPELRGRRFAECFERFEQAIPIGVVRGGRDGFECVLAPARGYRIGERDRLVFVAESLDVCEVDGGAWEPLHDPGVVEYSEREPSRRRILILGWGHMIASMLEEFELFVEQRHDVVILSAVSIEERERQLAGYALELERVTVTHVEGDYTTPVYLERVEPLGFDFVICLASEWVKNPEESDARTIVGALLLEEILSEGGGRERPEVLVELTDEGSEELLDGLDVEVVVSAVLEGHMLAQVALRRELRVVFDALFRTARPQFDFRPVRTYDGVEGERLEFGALQRVARRYGEVLIGVRVAREVAPEAQGGVVLNPGRESEWELRAGDDFIVLVG